MKTHLESRINMRFLGIEILQNNTLLNWFSTNYREKLQTQIGKDHLVKTYIYYI